MCNFNEDNFGIEEYRELCRIDVVANQLNCLNIKCTFTALTWKSRVSPSSLSMRPCSATLFVSAESAGNFVYMDDVRYLWIFDAE